MFTAIKVNTKCVKYLYVHKVIVLIIDPGRLLLIFKLPSYDLPYSIYGKVYQATQNVSENI